MFVRNKRLHHTIYHVDLMSKAMFEILFTKMPCLIQALSATIITAVMYISFVITWFQTMAATVYPKKYAYGFVVLCFGVVMQSLIMNSHEVFIHIHQGCFAGTGAIVRLPQCQWSKPDGYGKISRCITTTKHSKAKTVCIFLGIYCSTELSGSVHGGSTSFSRL